MPQLSDAHHALIDQAAALVAPATRAMFVMHVHALIANGGDVLGAVLTALAWRGIAVGRSYFASAPQRPPTPRHEPSVSRRARFAAAERG